MTGRSWKQALGDRMPEALAREIDEFETDLALKKQGRIEDRLFAEKRLRRGAYGQRYDNGRRHDGDKTRRLEFPSGACTKGPETLWDAPGMQRIKIPFGGLSPEQMEVLADVAEEVSDGILHVTTRQDVQLHYVHLEDTPDLMRRLAAVDITTREACGNAVRNVTTCERAGVCPDETFDVTPHARASAAFLLGHPDTQDFGRKFKVAFSGCAGGTCGMARINDIGAVAAVRDGQRGFVVYVGGGLGSVPQQAQLLEDFVPEEELLPTLQAICRLFARHGEKKNRGRARLKFLLNKLGIEAFRELVRTERAALHPDPRWTAHLAAARDEAEVPRSAPGPSGEARGCANATPQRQPGYAAATVVLPLGDLSARQMRGLADLARRTNGGHVRATISQNLLFRWLSTADLAAFQQALERLGLGEPGADGLRDITACPGTDTCKLGLSSSRGLARELRERLATRLGSTGGSAVRGLSVKASGCFNSCGQHHVADIGLLGVSRRVGRHLVPHFQVVIGGERRDNAGSFGLPVGAVPSKRVPEAVRRLLATFAERRLPDETFSAFVKRYGRGPLRALLEDLKDIPGPEAAPELYSDFRDPRRYSTEDLGLGECAGEVVPRSAFSLQSSERAVFEAQLLLDRGDTGAAVRSAYQAMVDAARALLEAQDGSAPATPDRIAAEFRTRLCETGLFHDPFVGDKFAHYFLRQAPGIGAGTLGPDEARQRIDEASLFVDAAHACYARLGNVT